MSSTMIQRFRKAKQDHPGSIVLLAFGDFLETFEEDAIKVADTLGCRVTRYGRRGYIPIAMVGFTAHCPLYVKRLIDAGFQVEIVDSRA